MGIAQRGGHGQPVRDGQHVNRASCVFPRGLFGHRFSPSSCPIPSPPHNPEAVTCPATLGSTRRSTLLLEPIHVFGVHSSRRLAVVRVRFDQIWPRWWRKIVVVADDLAIGWPE